MTKKHFVAIAAALKTLRDKSEDTENADRVARAIAVVCAESNPRFNRTRFLGACQ